MKNKLSRIAVLGAILIMSGLFCPGVFAQENTATSSQAESITEKKLRIVTKTVKPFVMDDALKGFSIDLWTEIAKDLNLNYEFFRVNSVSEMLEAVKNGDADAGMAAVTINSEREKSVDFSHPFYDSGLQILIPFKNKSGLTLEMLAPLAKIFGVVLILMLISAHLVWFFERKDDPDFRKGYLEGVWDGFWWSAVTVTTVGYGDKTPKKVFGRIIGLIWMFAGLFIIAYFTSTVTSTLTVQQLQSSINGPSDLPGKIVATVENTSPQRYIEEVLKIKPVTFPTIDDAFAAVENGSVEAMVYDAPVLQYFAATDGAGIVKIVGKPFKPEAYGVVLPKGSSLRREINITLLKLKEDGTYEEIYKKWFGEEDGS